MKYRLLESHDLENVHELHSIPHVDEFNALGIPENKKETEKILSHLVHQNKDKAQTNRTYGMELKDQKFIGVFGLNFSSEKYNKAEVWFKLNPHYWNKGYASEALRFFLNECFEKYQLHRVEAGCAVENLGSRRVMEKCGFMQEGIQRQNLPLKSGWSDNFEFGLLREEWKKTALS